MIKLGMIGCGNMAHFHGPHLKNLPGVKVTICCDLIDSKAKALAETLGAKSCTDYRRVLEEVDAIWVCTEPFNRVEIVLGAAAAGKDIFTEKPLALNIEDADRMIAACRQAQVIYMLGYCLRFTQPYRLIHDLFAAGEFGALVNIWTRRYMPADFRGCWYGDQKLSGGVALDFGSHDIDWMHWVGGKVRTVFARTARVRDGAQADEHAQSLLRFANGAMGSCDVTWLDAVNESSVGLVGTRGSVVVGRDGKVVKKTLGQPETFLDVATAMAVDPQGHVGRRGDAGDIQAVQAADETMYEHFRRCVEDRQAPLTEAATGRQALETVLAIRRSAQTGQSVDLPT